MTNKVTVNELAANLTQSCNLSQEVANKAIFSTINYIYDSLVEGRTVRLRGLGTLRIGTHKGHYAVLNNDERIEDYRYIKARWDAQLKSDLRNGKR